MRSLLAFVFLLQVCPLSAEAQQRQTPFREADMLPVHSRSLSPSTVVSRRQAAPGMPAIFLIGDDPTSQAWLKRRLPVLRQLKAVGLVVQVNSAADLSRIRALAPGLDLYPASADDLAQRLKLTHYPVLITAMAIEQ